MTAGKDTAPKIPRRGDRRQNGARQDRWYLLMILDRSHVQKLGSTHAGKTGERRVENVLHPGRNDLQFSWFRGGGRIPPSLWSPSIMRTTASVAVVEWFGMIGTPQSKDGNTALTIGHGTIQSGLQPPREDLKQDQSGRGVVVVSLQNRLG